MPGSDTEQAGDEGEHKLPPALRADPNAKSYTYRDFANLPEEPDDDSRQLKRGSSESSIRVQKFPVKLYAILSHKEFSDIITWMPHGRSWKVLKPNAFESLVMPLFFEYSNYHSFNRLVNAWSFRRLSSGPDRGSYYHELFLRGRPHLQKYMRRLPKTHKKLPMKKADEPDFYKLDKTSPLPDIPEALIPPGMMPMGRPSLMGPGGAAMARTPSLAGAARLPTTSAAAFSPEAAAAAAAFSPEAAAAAYRRSSLEAAQMDPLAAALRARASLPMQPSMPLTMQPPALPQAELPAPLDYADPSAQYYQQQRMRHLQHLQMFQRQIGTGGPAPSPGAPGAPGSEEELLRLQQAAFGYRGPGAGLDRGTRGPFL